MVFDCSREDWPEAEEVVYFRGERRVSSIAPSIFGVRWKIEKPLARVELCHPFNQSTFNPLFLSYG